MTIDAAVVGGGLAGAALALALAEKNIHVALIDASIAKEDSRLIALNFHSVYFFKKLNLWSRLVEFAAEIKQVNISHRGHFGGAQIQAKDFKLPYLGYVVPAKNINQVLYEKINHPLIEIFQPAKVTDVSQQHDKVQISFQQNQELKQIAAKVVIAADGTHSTIRNLLNIAIEKVDYQQSALVTVTQLNRSHENIAYERFQEQGAIAMLPLPDNQAATIWTAQQEKISALMALSDEDFLQELQKQFGYRLGRFLKTHQRATYPLHYVRSHQQQVDRIVLIGNAAHTMHPIAAQGLNLALYEIAEICKQLDKNHLSEFVFDQTKQKASMEFSHRLNSFFSFDFFLLNTMRSLSLIGLDLFPILKKRFILNLIQ